ncbi:MAG: endonuclease/exonuclease/phosphatase family protein [Actinomycetota bacterium]
MRVWRDGLLAALAARTCVFLQESTPGWERQIRARLGHRYPQMAFHHEDGAGGLAVLSRYPFSGEVISSAAGWFPAWRWQTSVGLITHRLDHIFYTPQLVPFDARVLQAGRSDHLPVVAEFETVPPT